MVDETWYKELLKKINEQEERDKQRQYREFVPSEWEHINSVPINKKNYEGFK